MTEEWRFERVRATPVPMSQEEKDAAVRRVAEAHGLPETWLADGMRTFFETRELPEGFTDLMRELIPEVPVDEP